MGTFGEGKGTHLEAVVLQIGACMCLILALPPNVSGATTSPPVMPI
jgi:hypothetical protein